MSKADETRAAITRDLRPVRPLWSPARRALLIAPLALATLVAIPSFYFFRSDLAALGFFRAWGLSLLESFIGLVVVSLALVESIPGRTLSSRALAATFLVGLATPLVLVAINAESFSIGGPPGSGWSDGVACFRTSALGAVPALLVAAVLVARAFPLRPGIAGALYGLGCGVIADAGLRLFCDFTVPSHVLGAHGGAVAAALACGCLLAQLTTPRS